MLRGIPLTPYIPLLRGVAELKVCVLLKTLMNVRPSDKQRYSQMGSQPGNLGGHTGKPQKRWAIQGKDMEEKGHKKAEIMKSRGYRK